MKFYTVDRFGTLKSGMELRLDSRRLDATTPEQTGVIDHIHEAYPDGFSSHGMRYHLFDHEGCSDSVYVLECAFELVRQAHYRDKPSRFQSAYACDALHYCRRVQVEWLKVEAMDLPMFEVHPQSDWHRGDMRLLDHRNSMASITYRAHLYWQGRTYPSPQHNPLWEYVMRLPVRIGTQVEDP